MKKSRFAEEQIGKPTQIAQQQSTVSSVMGAFLPSGAGLTGIPINSAPPKVVMRPHIQYQGNLFAACPAEVPDRLQRLYASVGYYFGGGVPVAFDWVWQRNVGGVWTDIAGAAGTVALADLFDPDWGGLDLGPALASAQLRLGVTARNEAGAVTTYSAPVTVPAVLPRAVSIIPEGVPGAVPTYFRTKWTPGTPGFAYRAGRYREAQHWSLGDSGAVGPRLWSLQSLPFIGDVSAVPEGDVCLMSYGGGYANGNSNTQIGVGLRATGENEAATGYIASLVYNGATITLRVTRYVNGVATVYNSANLPNVPRELVFFRVNWRLVNGSLRIALKAWAEATKAWAPIEEPDWQYTYVDPAPLPSGELGYGFPYSRDGRALIHMGVSVDPDVPAPIVGPAIHYTPV